jgi:hypothetical protein
MVKKWRAKMPVMKRWQQWGFHWIYGPVYPLFIWYILISRFRFFFTASNPGIENGGFIMESKKPIYDALPQYCSPVTLYFESGTDSFLVRLKMEEAGIDFPAVIKPDIGCGGRAVMAVQNEEELKNYVNAFTVPFLIQPMVSYPHEIGLFFVRMPDQEKGFITGITSKVPGFVIGDGASTLAQLIHNDERLKRQEHSLGLQFASRLDEVLPRGQEEIVVPIGNRGRGAAYYDWSHLIDDRLTAWVNKLAKKVPGFYYGRLDIKYQNWEALLQGKYFSIIELNGAGSGPAHMFDPKHNVWHAWREIAKHYRLLYNISRKSFLLGNPYMSFSEGINLFKSNFAYDEILNALHEDLTSIEKSAVLSSATV